MLNNLKAEYVRKGITPYKGIMSALKCSEKTARNKLSEKCPITIPNTVTSIGEGAFTDCSSLTSADISEGVTTIGEDAFYGCKNLTSVTIPNTVTTIEKTAFSYCSSLTNVVISEGVTTIGDGAFNECSGLTNVTIPNTVTTIGNSAFSGCRGLTSITISEGVTTIEESAFRGCSNLTSVAIPEGVTTIGKKAFYNCNKLTSVTIPDSVTNIGDDAFAFCSITDMYINKIEDSIGTGNAPDSTRVHWAYDLSKCTAVINDFDYANSAITPTAADITVTSPNGKTLYYGTDYVIKSVSNNEKPGTATARIVPPEGGISILSQDVPFNIVGIDLSGATVTFPENITYQGEPCEPAPTVIVNGKTLTKGTDYTVSYSDNNGIGTGKAKIIGIGTYIGSIKATFEIEEFDPNRGNFGSVDISKNIVTATIDGNFIYNGAEHTPKPKLVYHFTNPTTGITLDYDMVEGTDYAIVKYENNINAGTAKIKICGIGTFDNEKTIAFNISPSELSETTITDIPSYEYCKKDICPEPEIKIGDKVMQKDVDYELSYENNRNRGTATVTITGKGNLSGTVTKNFEITPRDGSRFTYYIILT